MANVTYIDDLQAGTNVLFHQPSQQMRNYISNNVNNYLSNINSTAPHIGEIIKQKYEAVTNSATVQYLANLKNRITSTWNTNSVKYLSNLNDIQQAPDVMKRWIMAHPELRERWNNNAIAGYNGQYKDSYPDTVGKDHYDYRRVTDGVVMKDNSGNVGYSNYYEKVYESDLLNIIEKTNILSTFDIINKHISEGNLEDPTSVWNELM